MTKQIINVGSAEQAGDGESIRSAFIKINQNFDEVYLQTDGSQGTQGVQGITGNQGSQGITGAGVQGIQGITGSQGAQGISGGQGAQGTQGITGAGAQGIQGITGGRGIQGLQGISGDIGLTGGQGTQGIQGITGGRGIQGLQGISGTAGDDGVAGSQGIQGTQGITGGRGIQGLTGIQGSTGAGVQGTQGITGGQGVQGRQGIQGNTGAGVQGTQGITGAQGVQGLTGTGLVGWAVDINNHFLPNTDILQDIGTPTNRVRHIYVGPGSITVGSSVITESSTGKLVLPGITRGVNYTIDEVEDKGDQTYAFAGIPVIIDAAHYDILRGVLNAPQGYQPPEYAVDDMDDGEIDGINVVSQGAGLDQTVANKMREQMRAYIGSDPDPINNFQAIDWIVIPFTVSTEAADIEYENSGGAGDRLVNEDYELVLDSAGHISLPGGDIRQQIDNDLVIRVSDADDDGYRLDLIVVDDNDDTLTRVEVHRDGVEILTNLQGQSAYGWYFKDTGNLQLPQGGDIVDSNGTSVLGGSTNLGNFKIIDGILGTQGETSNDWGSYNINIDPGGESYAYIYLPSVANQNNGESLQLHSYATETSQIQLFGRGGVQITTTDNGNNPKVFEFDNRGILRLPADGDIINSSGQSVLGGGSNSYTPEDINNWNDPTVNTIAAALDELAARVAALQNFEIDGGNAYTPALGEIIIDGNGA